MTSSEDNFSPLKDSLLLLGLVETECLNTEYEVTIGSELILKKLHGLTYNHKSRCHCEI